MGMVVVMMAIVMVKVFLLVTRMEMRLAQVIHMEILQKNPLMLEYQR